jgi:hypothetical protein
MLPITDFLSCTEPIDEFESLSSEQQHHTRKRTLQVLLPPAVVQN